MSTHLDSGQSGASRLRRIVLGLVLLGYLAGTFYTMLTTPLHRGPDESQHLQYVRYLAEGHGLPVMRLPPALNVASQESAQPPVYYTFVALLTFWADSPTITRLATPPLERVLGFVHRRHWTHPTDAAFFEAPPDLRPQASIVSGYTARLPSLAFGLGALVLLFLVLRSLVEDDWSALVATAWLGWNANFTFIHAFVTPDALLALLSAGALGLMLMALRRGLDSREPLWLGLSLGLLVLTKLNGLALVPAATVALAAMPRPWSDRRRAAFVAGLLFTLVAGWWFLRNLILYGEPTGLRMMAAIEGAKGGVNPQPLTWHRVAEMLLRGYRTFASPRLRLFGLLAGLGFGGALLGLKSARWRRSVLFLGFVVALGVVPFVVWANAFVYGWHARLFLPVWPALAGLWAIGFTVLVPRRVRPHVALLVIAVLGSQLVLRISNRQPGPQKNTYYYLPVISEADRAALAGSPMARAGDALLLHRVETAQRSEWLGDQELQILYATLLWETVGGISDRDTAFFVHLIAPDGTRIGQVDTFHEVDTPPLVAWPVGQMVVHLNRLVVPAEYIGRPLTFHIGVYNKRTGERWPIWVTGEAQARDRLEVPAGQGIHP